jgi:hypothetical protein
MTALSAVVPRRVRELIMRAIGADRVLWQVDDSARRGYELRAARSEPALEPAPGAPGLSEAGR